MTEHELSGPVPGYVLGEVIGQGGFATVYRARQISLARDVAIKIDSRVLDDVRNQRRFLREATASALISSHPHVISLIDAGTTRDNRPYLVMELCDAGSLGQLVRRQGPLSPADVVELGIAISSALAAAHERGILHRDIKPANILIDPYGTPRLGDFGLASLSAPGQEMSVTLDALTPAYAAPEAFEQAKPSKRADVWALGATLYAILTGVAPRHHADGSPQTVAEMVQNLYQPLPAKPYVRADPLMNVIWRATAPQSENRFADATELHAALVELRGRFGSAQSVLPGSEVTRVSPIPRVAQPQQGAMVHLGGPPNPGQRLAGPEVPPAVERTTRPRRAWPVLVTLFALMALGGGTLLGMGWFGNLRNTQTSAATQPGTAGSASPSAQGSLNPTFEVASSAVCYQRTAGSAVQTLSEAEVSCDQEHYWERYASGELTSATTSVRDSEVAADASVQAACTQANLEKYAGTSPDVVTLMTRVPTPDEFAAGERGFVCLAGGATTSGSYRK